MAGLFCEWFESTQKKPFHPKYSNVLKSGDNFETVFILAFVFLQSALLFPQPAGSHSFYRKQYPVVLSRGQERLLDVTSKREMK